MSKLRIAIAEDDERALQMRKEYLTDLGEQIEVIFAAASKKDFFKEYENHKGCLDALILDIEMESRHAGLDIATELQIPVLFTSDYNAENLKTIEDLKDSIPVVETLTKPFSEDKFKSRVLKFREDILAKLTAESKIPLKVNGRHEYFSSHDIVFICTAEKGEGAESNNKIVFFTNHKPIILCDFSFKKIAEWNLPSNPFRQIHKSYFVNSENILGHDREHVEVEFLDEKNNKVRKKLPISDNYKRNIP